MADNNNNKFNNDSTMASIKEVLEDKSKEFLIDQLLDAFWKYPDQLLRYSPIWNEHLALERRKYLYENNMLTPEQLADLVADSRHSVSHRVYRDYTDNNIEAQKDWPDPPEGGEDILTQRVYDNDKIWRGRLIVFFTKHKRKRKHKDG